MKHQTGGYVIIPIEKEDGSDFNILTTTQSIKAGTYQKFIRAIKLNKTIIVPNVQVSEGKASCAVANTLPGTVTDFGDVIRFAITTILASGTGATVNISITSNDTVYRS